MSPVLLHKDPEHVTQTRPFFQCILKAKQPESVTHAVMWLECGFESTLLQRHTLQREASGLQVKSQRSGLKFGAEGAAFINLPCSVLNPNTFTLTQGATLPVGKTLK